MNKSINFHTNLPDLHILVFLNQPFPHACHNFFAFAFAYQTLLSWFYLDVSLQYIHDEQERSVPSILLFIPASYSWNIKWSASVLWQKHLYERKL